MGAGASKNNESNQPGQVKKTKQTQNMSQRMKNFTEERDKMLNKDVEGQMLAGVLEQLRVAFGADSKEYIGIRELLIAGIQVEELQGRAQALEEGRAKYSSDSPEYQAYRERCLYAPGVSEENGGEEESGRGGLAGNTKKKKKKKKKTKKDSR
jgi:hypothetical protein